MKHETFGDILRERRTARGLSQRSLAERMSELGVKVDATAITRMENGQREAKLNEALALADYFGIDLASVPYLAEGQGRLTWQGLMDEMVHGFYKTRLEIREFLDVAGYAHSGFGYDQSDTPGVFTASEKAGGEVKAIIRSLVGREADLGERAAPPLPHADSELCEWLVRELVKGLWDQADDVAP
ncbi:multiprotein-bridging factor 1 family protein [Prescottella equi]|uniref:helix-turn-helix domain-containing protein n=1 Tax=Rhodococcus hoagii TaxID=43767 RepID=UPI00384B340B